MSRRTKAARRSPPCSLSAQSLAAALLLTPYALACSASDEAARAAKTGPLAPSDDPIVRVVPIDDPAFDASVPTAPAHDGGAQRPRDAGRPVHDASARDAAEDETDPGADDGDEAGGDEDAAAPSPPRTSARDAGAAAPTATTSVTCLPPAAASGTGTVLASTPASVQTPAGAVEVSVQATGTGCPPCTSRTTLAPDGATFTTEFSAMEVAAGGADAAPKECVLALKLRSSAAQAYAVASLTSRGAASLQRGQSASQVARHRAASAGATTDATTELSGPHDGPYSLDAQVATRELVWSECGLQRDLSVSTTLSLRAADLDDGWISLSESGGGLTFKLDARPCTP